jgi:hypothetical protein
MSLPITIPNTFATETNNIPLSELDANFTTVTNAINGIGNGSEALANVAITGGTATNLTANVVSISNATITGGSITGITPIAVVVGGTGANSAATARTNLGAAASGANSDITALSGLTTALSVAQGGTGSANLTANSVVIGNGVSAVSGVAPGTSGNVLTSNGTSWTSSSQSGLGYGQTYTNVLSSRAFATTYTNSTAKPMFVAVSAYTNVTTSDVTFSININSGGAIPYASGTPTGSQYRAYAQFTFIVPPGQTYAVTASQASTLSTWVEFS